MECGMRSKRILKLRASSAGAQALSKIKDIFDKPSSHKKRLQRLAMTTGSCYHHHLVLALYLVGLLLPIPIEASLGSIVVRPWAVATSGVPRTSANARSYPSTNSAITKKKTAQIDDKTLEQLLQTRTSRGGQDADAFVRTVDGATQLFLGVGRAVLPPAVAIVKSVVQFYHALPTDVILAQIGLVYCFAGGYYPTLFSSLQAAQHCGWNVMVDAISELTEEAIKVIDATSGLYSSVSTKQELFLRQTSIVLKTVDPIKINQAAAALYTTWLGVSAVLEKEYARTISMSLTLAGFFERIAHFLLEPPARMCIGEDYHKWVPVIIGWACKGLAMNIAWRVQRLLTASASAITGGLLFSKAILRMVWKKRHQNEAFDRDETPLDDIIGFLIAALGFYTQFQSQYKSGFSFAVPFPINLITWPFDWAEKWIQWQITK
jgi:hypothetical protein